MVNSRTRFRPRLKIALKIALQIATAVFMIAYPMIVYVGLTRAGTRFAALGLLVVSLAHTFVNIRKRIGFASLLRSLLPLPLCALAFYLDDERYVLAMPVLINATLFTTFFGTLWTPLPLCERFARMQVKDLSASEVVYCRSITKLWCAFFVLNGATAAALAVLGELELWTLYTGLISYLLIGLLAAGEYTVRKYRFGRYGDGLHDRMLRALFNRSTHLPPVRSTPP